MLSAYLLNAGSELWGKKWRNAILFILRDGPKRFSEIKKEMPNCSVKMLSEALDEMEHDRLLVRKQYHTIPVKVTYELGPDLEPMLDVLKCYHKALLYYFKKNYKRLKVPPHIAELLEREEVPVW